LVSGLALLVKAFFIDYASIALRLAMSLWLLARCKRMLGFMRRLKRLNAVFE